MKCPKCGYDNKDGAEHCDLCKEILAKPPEFGRPRNGLYQSTQDMSAPPSPPRIVSSSTGDDRIHPIESIIFGWDTMKEHIGLLIGVMITFFAIGYFESIIITLLFGALRGLIPNILSLYFIIILLSIIIGFVNTCLSLGVNKISLNLVDRGSAEYSDLFSCFHLGVTGFLAAIILALILAAILVVTFIPIRMFLHNNPISILLIFLDIFFVAIFAVHFIFIYYLIVDKECGPLEAVIQSYNMTKGNFIYLVFFISLTFLIIISAYLISLAFSFFREQLLGRIIYLIYLIFAVPIVGIATAHVYRQLSKKS